MSDWQSRTAENAQRYRDLGERVAQLSITETSRDGAVQVTVSANGLLTDLVLAETTRPMADVAAQVMDCLRRAQARIPDLLRQAMTESVGTADPNTHLLVADARRRFPEPPPLAPDQRAWQPDEIRFSTPETAPTPPPPARPAAAPPRPRRAREPVEELWDEERPVLKDV